MDYEFIFEKGEHLGKTVGWVSDNDPDSLQAMPFSGTIILLPLLVISFGYVYKVEEVNNE